MKQILYGVGQSVLRDYVNKNDIIAFSKLKDVVVNFSGEEEAVTGGDSPYPITYFPRDKSIQITATNALFDIKMVNVTQGAVSVVGAVNMTEFIDLDIPSDGIITLDNTPIAGSIVIEGFTLSEDVASAGTYTVLEDVITFAVADAGKTATGIYERVSNAKAETVSGKTDTFSKPVTFIHRIPIYDDNTQIVAQGQLIVYKAKSDNAFEFNFQPQTAFAPRLVLNALDAKRADKKLWDFTVEPIEA